MRKPVLLCALLLMLPLTGSVNAGDVFNGATLYSQNCAQCHGANGRGFMSGTPDFTNPQFKVKRDGDLRQVIKFGRNTMPAYQSKLKDSEIDDVIAHIRTFF